MNVKNLAEAIVNRSAKFLKDNGKNIAVTVLAEALDVPITTTSRTTYRPQPTSSSLTAGYSYPRNATEAAIESMYGTAKNMVGTEAKLSIAHKIFEIAQKSDDISRIYAIKNLEKIQSLIVGTDARKEIAMLIGDLSSVE